MYGASSCTDGWSRTEISTSLVLLNDVVTADRSRFQRRRRVQKSAMQTFEAALIDIDSEACKSASHP